jgi:hypothetical protein
MKNVTRNVTLFIVIALLCSSGAAAPSSAVLAAVVQKSSGLFGLPANAQSVDWMVLNNSLAPATVVVTVFKAGVGPKTAVPPGTLVMTIPPGESRHNANGVGVGRPFTPGAYYEVVVQTNQPNVLPSVHVWQDSVNTVIPGTLIPPGAWVTLQ